MKKVVTTNMSEKLHVAIKEFHKVVPEGVQFMVTDSRYVVLSGYNNYHAVFVTEVIGEDNPDLVLHGDLVEHVEPTEETCADETSPESEYKEVYEESPVKEPIQEKQSKKRTTKKVTE